MANLRNPSFGSTDLELVSSQLDKAPSVLFTMIPGAVKHGLSKMPSLRRSISSYNLRARPTLMLNRPQSLDLGAFELHTERARLASSVSTAVTARPASGLGADAGWKYANQGLSLLETAVQEARCSDNGNPAFARQLYIHSLAYLLRGLPSDMSEAEAASLRPGITPILERGHVGCSSESSSSGNGSATSPSLLHRLLASGIVQLFILFSFILPYVKYFLRSAYRYERTNHISERVFAASMDTLDQVGRHGFGFAGSILNSGNGRIGGILAGICAWWIDGISGGIHDGVGEGMAMIGNYQRISG
ncbi:hypothetical protein MMC17_004511 [Xylographa soralifera]|nr:hypothetical protein [Xylographa soralifera]